MTATWRTPLRDASARLVRSQEHRCHEAGGRSQTKVDAVRKLLAVKHRDRTMAISARTLLATVVALPALGAGIAVGASHGDRATQSTLPADAGISLSDLRAEVHGRHDQVGRGYACAVVTRGRDPRVLLLAAGEPAFRRARALAASASDPDRVLVRSTAPRYRQTVVRAIRRQAQRTAPAGGRFALAYENPIGLDRCRRVEITLNRRARTSKAEERWATRLRARHDLVRIRRGPLQDDIG
ncbi:MAG: hypothetical protein AB7G37_20965 [Solirubrobacteraceae bacterium]